MNDYHHAKLEATRAKMHVLRYVQHSGGPDNVTFHRLLGEYRTAVRHEAFQQVRERVNAIEADR